MRCRRFTTTGWRAVGSKRAATVATPQERMWKQRMPKRPLMASRRHQRAPRLPGGRHDVAEMDDGPHGADLALRQTERMTSQRHVGP